MSDLDGQPTNQQQVTIDEAESLGTVALDVSSVMTRHIVGGQDEELVAMTTVAEGMRTLSAPARKRVLTWFVSRFGEADD
jgi:hypothetical protein